MNTHDDIAATREVDRARADLREIYAATRRVWAFAVAAGIDDRPVAQAALNRLSAANAAAERRVDRKMRALGMGAWS